VTPLLRMRLFGYIAVFVDDIRDDERIISIAHIGEEEVPNVKRMHVGEEEVPVPHGLTVMVPSEEEDVPVL
jgi:hypothetical protein